MTIKNYLSEPINKRKDIVKNADWQTCPFWLERLQTAIEHSSPLVVSFDKILVAEYWALKSQN